MKRDRMASAASWFWSTVIALCVCSPAIAQRPSDGASRANLLPTPGSDFNPTLPLPLPFEQGARWLRYSLLAPPQQPVQQPPPAKPLDSRELRELEAVQNRLGSVRDGTSLAGDPAEDQAARRRFWEQLEKQRIERESQLTRRVSDDGEALTQETLPHENLPSSMPWSDAADPLQAATEHLRATARNLDSVAADLEDAGRYKEADRLRSRAQLLRNDARSFSPTPEIIDRR